MTWSCHQAKALSHIFSELDSAGIEWLVLRNHEGLPETNRSKDVDLGLDKSDFVRARATIGATACAAGFDRVLIEEFQYVHCFTFFGYFGGEWQSLKIDLLDGFVYRGAQIFEFSQLLVRSRRSNGYRIPNAVDDGVMLWIKPLLTGGIVKSRYIDDILEAAKDNPEDFRASLERAFSVKYGRKAWEMIGAGEIEKTVAMTRILRITAWYSALRRSTVKTINDTLHHFISELIRRSHRNPATFISVAGPDGVGKTTFIHGLAAKLGDLQIKDQEAIIVRHFRPHVLPNIKTLLTGEKEAPEEFHNPHRATPASIPSSLMRLAYYWVDYVVGYWAVVRHQCVTGRTTIFDRYFYDFIVDPRRSRVSLPSWVARAFLTITPEPDLVFVLDSDPSVIFSRKQELPLDEIARQLKAYRDIASRDSDRFVLLDASRSPEVVVANAVNELVARSYPKCFH